MAAFFQAIFLVILFTVLFMLYYLVRNGRAKRRIKRESRAEKLQEQQRIDRINRFFLEALFNKILNDELFWFEAYPANEIKERVLVRKSTDHNYFVVNSEIRTFSHSDVNKALQCRNLEYEITEQGINIKIPVNFGNPSRCMMLLFEHQFGRERMVGIVYKY